MSTNCVLVLEPALANAYLYFHNSFWGMAYGKCLSTKQIPFNQIWWKQIYLGKIEGIAAQVS